MSISRDDWIDAAWDILGEAGVEGIRIEQLARKLSVTKGSFYWHFKNRQGLVDAMIERWLGMREEDRPGFSSASEDPSERLWKVIERGITRGTRGQAAALRLWGQRNPEVEEKIVAADSVRRQFFIDQFKALGHDDEKAEISAEVYMSVISAEFLHSGSRDETDRLAMARRKHEMLIG
jgi:AcrR family transcriptional regulator